MYVTSFPNCPTLFIIYNSTYDVLCFDTHTGEKYFWKNILGYKKHQQCFLFFDGTTVREALIVYVYVYYINSNRKRYVQT